MDNFKYHIEIMTLVATSFAALGAMWAAWIMKRQQEYSNIPCIVLSNNKIFKKRNENEFYGNIEMTNRHFIPLFNIGNGVAKDIIVHFSLNKSTLKKWLSELKNRGHIDDYSISESYISFEINQYNNTYFFYPCFDIFKEQFVQNEKNMPIAVILGNNYLGLLIALNRLLRIDQSIKYELSNQPMINIRISFSDIYNKRFVSYFKLSYIHRFTQNNDENKAEIGGDLWITKEKTRTKHKIEAILEESYYDDSIQ